MTDYQQAAIEAVKKERERHYVTFPSYEQSLTCACGSNVEGHTYSELVSAAEPHLRKKWAEEIIGELDIARATGKVYTYGDIQELIREGTGE